MSFSHYLSAAEAQEIVDAAVDSGVLLASRQLLLKGVRPKFAMYLPLDASPLNQFRGDLAAMNTVERLLDNSVPLEIFLANAAEQAGELPQSKVFRRYQNQVHNAAAGIATLAPMAEMPTEVMATKPSSTRTTPSIWTSSPAACAARARW